MFDLARLRGTALALAAVALGLAAMTAALRWATDHRPGWLPAVPSKMDVTALEKAGRRVARAAREARAGTGLDGRLGVILGSSSMQSALDPAPLAEGRSPRWLNLCGPDASPVDLVRIARLLERADLRPAVAVVGINLPALASPGDLLADAMLADPAPSAFRRSDPASGKGRLVRRIVDLARDSADWLRPGYRKIHYLKDLAVFEGRLAALLGAGAGVDAAFAPAAEDWTPPLAWIEPATDEFRAWQAREYARKGWFSADAYGPDGANVRALEGLLVGLHRRGARVVLVLLPEPAPLRARVPAEAGRRLGALLAALPPGDAPEVLDLREAVDDPRFADLVHLDPLGRALVTRRLARSLAEPPAVASRR